MQNIKSFNKYDITFSVNAYVLIKVNHSNFEEFVIDSLCRCAMFTSSIQVIYWFHITLIIDETGPICNKFAILLYMLTLWCNTCFVQQPECMTREKTSFTKIRSIAHFTYIITKKSADHWSNPQRTTVLSHLDNVDYFHFTVFTINKRLHNKTGYWGQYLNWDNRWSDTSARNLHSFLGLK